jgi:putative peptidoglycan lipid II flippase
VSDGEPAAPSSEADTGAAARGRRVRSALLVGVLTLLSRVVGLVRESTRAYFLGAGVAGDAFQVAFQIPNVFRRLVGEGAISSGLVPVMTELAQRESEARQREFAEKFLTLWIALVLIVVVLGVFIGPAVVTAVFDEGSFATQPGKTALTAELTGTLFWYLLPVGCAAAFQGLLNARNLYGAAAASPVLFNLGMIAVAWIFAPRVAPDRRAHVFAAAVLFGGFLQAAVLLPSLWRLGIRPRLRWPFDHEAVRRVLRLLVPAVFGAGIYQINVLVSTWIAGRLPEDGAVSVLSYSNRLMEVVLGVFVFAVGVVSLTALSERVAARDEDGFSRLLREVLDQVSFITVPSMVGLWILCRPVLALLLRGGEFGDVALDGTAEAFRWHVLGIACIGWNRLLVSAYYALGDVRSPVRIAAVNLVLHLSLCLILSAGTLSFRGIALAATIAALVQTVMLSLRLRRHLGGRSVSVLSPALGRALIASAVMGAALFVPLRWLEGETSKLYLALGVTASIAGGAAIYAVVTLLLGGSAFFGALLRRVGRRGPRAR